MKASTFDAFVKGLPLNDNGRPYVTDSAMAEDPYIRTHLLRTINSWYRDESAFCYVPYPTVIAALRPDSKLGKIVANAKKSPIGGLR